MNASYKLAEQDLDTVLRKEPANTEAYLLKAELHFHREDTNGFSILRTAYELVPSDERDQIVHAIAFSEFNLDWYARSIESYKFEQMLAGKKYKSTFCALAWAYSKIGSKDSACYYYKMCDEKVFRTIIDYNELEKLCGKR